MNAGRQLGTEDVANLAVDCRLARLGQAASSENQVDIRMARQEFAGRLGEHQGALSSGYLAGVEHEAGRQRGRLGGSFWLRGNSVVDEGKPAGRDAECLLSQRQNVGGNTDPIAVSGKRSRLIKA